MPIDNLLVILVLVAVVIAAASWWSARRLKAPLALLEAAPSERVPEGPPPRVGLILNPSKNHAERAEAALRAGCAAAGYAPPLVFTTTLEDPGRSMALEALAAGCTLLVAAGGDGTVREVAEVLAGDPAGPDPWAPQPAGAASPAAAADGTRQEGRQEGGQGTGAGQPPSPRTPAAREAATLAILPLGTGNLLARNLDIWVDDIDGAVHTALYGATRKVDAAAFALERADGRRDGNVFLVMAGIGMDADVMNDTRLRLKALAGPIAYAEAGLRHLSGQRRNVDISLDDGPAQRRRVRSVVFANCGKLQAGLDFVPDARIDDGLLDIVVMSPGSIGGWMWIAAKTAFRHRGSIPVIDYYQARKVRLSVPEPISAQLDGDPVGKVRSLTVWVLPHALSVRVPG
ncbi:diacylglycerol kinase family protein [Arthrobacter ginkgonis]|uniref:Diacylglycerol kinase family protein n=1 Tax=Arthrobacter ginkgonis TaxID=1630594 RepID=A0ABP7CYY4_9MICC